MDAEPPISRRGLLVGGVVVALVAAGVLALLAPLFDPGRLHVQSAFVDQGGYITTARTLLDTGAVESGLVYPAHVRAEGWRPYMPGHYACLALSYLVFGYGVFASYLPNLLGFVVSTVCAFLIGARLRGPVTGGLAAGLFVLFPSHPAYAFTAMAESTFTAAGMVAATVLVFLPRRWRPWGLPLVLALPFLFRETGALLVIPLGLFLVHGQGGARLAAGVLAVLGSVVLLWGVNQWQLASGKGAVPLSWVSEQKFNYTDAFKEPVGEQGLDDWRKGLGKNFSRNRFLTGEQWDADPGQIGLIGQGLFGVAVVLGLIVGAWRWRDGPWLLGAALLGLLLFAMIYFLYDVRGQKAMRSLMYTWPLFATGFAFPLGELWRRGKGPRLAILAGLVLASPGTYVAARQAGRELTENDEVADSGTSVLEQIHADGDALLVAPHEMMMNYLVENYPTRVSFPPENDETLELLGAKYRIGTLILPKGVLGKRLSLEAIRAQHLARRYPDINTDSERVYVVFGRVPGK